MTISPRNSRPVVKRKLAAAWSEPDTNMARKALEALADSLDRNYPGAAASLREGLEGTITVNRLMLSGALKRTVHSTNPIESAIEIARTTARRVKKWRSGNQVLRWTLAGLKEAGRRFRYVAGYRELPLLRMRLKDEIPKLLAAADVAVITLRSVDAFSYGISPNKLFDYMAAAKPVICAVPGDMARLVEDSGAGISVEPENPEALAKAVEGFLSMSAAERAAMGKRGRELVEREFSRERLVERLEGILTS